MNTRNPEGNIEPLASERLDLHEFLQPPHADYQSVIDAEGEHLERWDKRSLHTAYGADVAEYIQPHGAEENPEKLEVFDYLVSKVKGNIVVDLGGTNMRRFASALGAKAYIGVDKFAYEEEHPRNAYVDLTPTERKKDTDIISVKNDMLDFVSRLPDDSVCIIMNGIDGEIIRSDEYHTALAKEIMRVTKKDGLAFGRNSYAFTLMRSSPQSNPELSEMASKLKIRNVRFPYIDKLGLALEILEKKGKSDPIQKVVGDTRTNLTDINS